MAGTSTSQVRNFRDQDDKNEHLTSQNGQEKKLKGGSMMKSLQNVSRYEKNCRNWSILANVAAIISVSSAIYTILNNQKSLFKRNFRSFW